MGTRRLGPWQCHTSVHGCADTCEHFCEINMLRSKVQSKAFQLYSISFQKDRGSYPMRSCPSTRGICSSTCLLNLSSSKYRFAEKSRMFFLPPSLLSFAAGRSGELNMPFTDHLLLQVFASSFLFALHQNMLLSLWMGLPTLLKVQPYRLPCRSDVSL